MKEYPFRVVDYRIYEIKKLRSQFALIKRSLIGHEKTVLIKTYRTLKEATAKLYELKESLTVNVYGNNTKFSYNILSPEKMRELGFSINAAGTEWYKSKDLLCNISVDVVIPIENVEDSRVYVIDNDFLQPYDYQNMILESCMTTRVNKVAETCGEMVEDEMMYLQNNGVINGYEEGDYV